MLRQLNLTKVAAVEAMLAHFCPLERFPPKTFLALEEILEGSD